MPLLTTTSVTDSVDVDMHAHHLKLSGLTQFGWTWVTRGLTGFGQAELSFTLVGGKPSDEPPVEPAKLLTLLAKQVQDGKQLKPGTASRLGKSGMMGFQALYCLPAVLFEEGPNLADHLAILMVHQDEYEFARDYGFQRLIGHINRTCSSFPWPTWNTAARPGALPSPFVSVLDGLDRVRGSFTVTLQPTLLRLDIPRGARQALIEALGSGQPVACAAHMPEDPDACLTWQPGDNAAQVITRPQAPDRFALPFIILRQQPLSFSRFVEDGIEVSLSTADHRAVLESVSKGQPMDLRLGGRRFAISYDTRPARKNHAHVGKVATWSLKVPLVELINLVAVEPGAGSLATFVGDVQAFLNEAMAEEADAFALVIQYGNAGAPSVSANIELNPAYVEFDVCAVLGHAVATSR